MAADFPIVDAHRHFRDPFRHGGCRALRRPYLPADYPTDARPRDIVATVYVETAWARTDPIGGGHYVERLRRATVAMAPPPALREGGGGP